jgi:hypothetical protein
MGMRGAPFVPGVPAVVEPDAVDHDPGDHGNHPDQDDEMGCVLGQREPGDDDVARVGEEAVLREIEQGAEAHDDQTDARQPGEGWSGRLGGSIMHCCSDL